MVATRNILIASAVAPIGVVWPLLGFTFLLSYGFLPSMIDHPDRGFILIASTFGALSFHLALSVVYVVTGFALRQLGLLSRRVLFILGALLSLLIVVWLALDWPTYLSRMEALANLGIQAVVCFAMFTLLSTLWWRIAAGKRPKPTQSFSG